MNTTDKVMSWLEGLAEPDWRECYSDSEVQETARQALDLIDELLKEQEAKPVIVTTNAYGTRFYHCPRCNRDLYAYPRQLYCSNCGQAVKWE